MVTGRRPRFVQAFHDLWSTISGQKSGASMPELIVHDPDALTPHDLDDPFLDPQIQTRIGRVIADNAADKEASKRQQ